MQERTALEDRLTSISRIERELDDNIGMIELGEAEKDKAVIAEAEEALRRLKADVARREMEALLSGEADPNDAYLEVHAGAGGTESQDWANMLLRMYTRWAEKHGFKVEYLEETQGEEAGIKSATVQIKGRNAYGWLKTEMGVHRLVRISPYDSNARRHTSFASIETYPVIDDSIKVDIKEADVKTDTMRASGAGAEGIRHRAGDGRGCGVGRVTALRPASRPRAKIVADRPDRRRCASRNAGAGRSIARSSRHARRSGRCGLPARLPHRPRRGGHSAWQSRCRDRSRPSCRSRRSNRRWLPCLPRSRAPVRPDRRGCRARCASRAHAG